MTAIQKLEANEKREELFKKCGYKCAGCGFSIRAFGTEQLAHRIPKSVQNLKKYGDEVINHELNLVPVCSLRCNSRMNIGCKPIEIIKLVDKIRDKLLEE